ncbi:MAG: SDR family oxidoreductase [Myxococcaceae bacterium]
MRVVVTGANRGIGLEFVRQFLSRGDTVEATARDPERATELNRLKEAVGERLRIHRLDVADDFSVSAFADALLPGPVDLLVNNAGLGAWIGLDELDFQEAKRLFDVNALGPLRVTRALLPRLRQGSQKRIVHLTSRMGSIADNSSGGSYGYRMSKAALNMASRTLAVDLAGEGMVSVVLHPGWVQTGMGGEGATTTPTDAVEAMIRIIDGLGPDESGRFFHANGTELPW